MFKNISGCCLNVPHKTCNQHNNYFLYNQFEVIERNLKQIINAFQNQGKLKLAQFSNRSFSSCKTQPLFCSIPFLSPYSYTGVLTRCLPIPDNAKCFVYMPNYQTKPGIKFPLTQMGVLIPQFHKCLDTVTPHPFDLSWNFDPSEIICKVSEP